MSIKNWEFRTGELSDSAPFEAMRRRAAMAAQSAAIPRRAAIHCEAICGDAANIAAEGGEARRETREEEATTTDHYGGRTARTP